jgi:uncharacterized cupredoxin-like copper-binding protein
MRHARLSSFAAALCAIVLGFALAGCGGGGGGGSKNETVARITATNGKVTVDAHDISFSTREIDAKPGSLAITLDNKGALQHTFTIDKKVDISVSGGKQKTETAAFTAGTYTFYCKVPGHRSAGMVGKLVVK